MLPFWEQKCWGQVLHCFHNTQASVSYLRVREGWRCSNHYHQFRANTFIVISGKIRIFHTVKSTGELVEQVLMPSDTYTVPSKDIHRFEVIDSGEVIEVYYPDSGGKVDINDIVRFDVGGKISG